MPLYEEDRNDPSIREREQTWQDPADPMAVTTYPYQYPFPFNHLFGLIQFVPIQGIFINALCLLVLPFSCAVSMPDKELPGSGWSTLPIQLAFCSAIVVLMYLRGVQQTTICAVTKVDYGRYMNAATPYLFFGNLALLFGLPLVFLNREAPASEAAVFVLPGCIASFLYYFAATRRDQNPRPPPSAPVERKPVRGQGLLTLKQARGRVAESVPPDSPFSQPLIPWGPASLPTSAATLHFLALGAPGSGKTVALKALMNFLIQFFVSDRAADTRLLVYDPKPDMMSFLLPLGRKHGVSVATLNPFDSRGVAWDIAADITRSSHARQLAHSVVPGDPNESRTPYFIEAPRDIISEVVKSFIEFSPGEWTLRDLVLACRTRTGLEAVLSRSEDGRELLETHLTATQGDRVLSLLSTLRTLANRYEVIAASWEHAEFEVSISDWLDQSGVLVLGNSDEDRAPLSAINQLFFKRASELLLSQKEVPATSPRRTWVFLDELKDFGRMEGFSALLTKGRSKGVCVAMGFQDIAGLRAVFGNDEAESIAGLAANKCFFRIEDVPTREWASNAFSKVEVQQTTTGGSSGEQKHIDHTSTSEGESISHDIRDVAVVSPQEFHTLPFASVDSGVHAYYLSGASGPYYGAHPGRTASADGFILTMAPRFDDDEDLVPRLPETQTLVRWNTEDYARLGLAAPATTQPDSPEPPQSRPPSGGIHDLER